MVILGFGSFFGGTIHRKLYENHMLRLWPIFTYIYIYISNYIWFTYYVYIYPIIYYIYIKTILYTHTYSCENWQKLTMVALLSRPQGSTCCRMRWKLNCWSRSVVETQGWVAVVLGWVWVNCQKSEIWWLNQPRPKTTWKHECFCKGNTEFSKNIPVLSCFFS